MYKKNNCIDYTSKQCQNLNYCLIAHFLSYSTVWYVYSMFIHCKPYYIFTANHKQLNLFQ